MKPDLLRETVLVTFLPLLALACGKTDAASETSSAPPAPIRPVASTVLAPSASAHLAPPNLDWKGTYTSAPGSLYVIDGGEWKGVHFRGDDASIALGEGPITITVDTKTKGVRGTASGPLGETVISGAITGEELTFSVLRKDPSDRGLTGIGVGTVHDNSVTGTMRLSQGDAHVIREATFSLTKVAP